MNPFELIDKGYYIIPVQAKEKLPLFKDWPNKATRSREQVEKWAAAYPGCNWGIVCSNVIVFDLDRKKKDADGNEYFLTDEEMFEHWNYFRETYHLPEAPEVITGSGGRHFYYKRPAGDFIAATGFKYVRDGETVKSNIDIRVGNSFVLAPGSVNADGNEYICPSLWAGNELNELPADFVEILPKRNLTAAPKSAQAAPLTAPEVGDYGDAAAYIDTLEPSIQGQGGSSQFLRACNLLYHEWGFDRNDPQARAILDRYNARAVPPWQDWEIEHKLNEVYDKTPDKPFGCRRRAYQMNAALKLPLDFTVNGERVTDGITQAADNHPEQSTRIFKPDVEDLDETLSRWAEESELIPTGFPALDAELGGGLPPGLITVGAMPSLGKTAFMLQVADRIVADGRSVLFVSLEMSKESLQARTLSRLTGIQTIKDADVLTPMDMDTIGEHLDEISELSMTTQDIVYGKNQLDTSPALRNAYEMYKRQITHRYILEAGDGGEAVSAQMIDDYIEDYETQFLTPPDVVIVDYLHLIKNGATSQKDDLDQSMTALKRITRKHHIPVIVISSLNRTGYKETAQYSNFNGSSGIEYSADILISLNVGGLKRNSDSDIAAQILDGMARDVRDIELTINKNRDGRTGGKIAYSMFARCGLFVESGLQNEEREYREESADEYKKRSWSLNVIGNNIAAILADVPGHCLPLGDGTPDTDDATGRTVFGNTLLSDSRLFPLAGFGLLNRDTLIKVCNRTKSNLKLFYDENGKAQVELVTRKPKLTGKHSTADILPPGLPTECVPRELDEQDKFDSID